MRTRAEIIAEEEAEDARIRREQTFIYVIRARPSGNLKIGIAIEPGKRLRGMQAGNWERLEIVTMYPGDRKLERQLHQDLAEHCIDREWFRPHPAVLDLVRAVCRAQK